MYAQDSAADRFDVRIQIPAGFPVEEPKVWELEARIPRTEDRHMNGNSGECCLTVWEAWRASTTEQTFETFMEGPVADFFLGQSMVELGDDWPFDELPHGRPGIVKAFAEVIGHVDSEEEVAAYLKILSRKQLKGHLLCPCGSGKIIRKCHRSELEAVATRIDPSLATKMLERL